jgi:pimeloyl-ACP methyl ester carboxylesterase
MAEATWHAEHYRAAGTEVHLLRGGEGPPLFILHGEGGNPGWLAYLDALAADFTVYAPSHPGFGMTPRPEWITTVPDLAIFYLWLLEEMGLGQVHLLGHGMGGWLAAEIATVQPQLVNRLVLVSAMGIKPHDSEILDLFLLTPQDIQTASFYDPTQVPEWQQLYGTPPTPAEADRAEEALETLMRLGWKPYMHNPRLPFLLPRLKRPALLVWGREDAIVPLECAQCYQHGIAGAQLTILEACGHYPQIEYPRQFADTVRRFLMAA